MKMMTKEIERRMPKLYSQDGKNKDDIKIIVKFFCPWNQWTWYATEGDFSEEDNWLFFGYVVGLEKELGYFSLQEMERIKGGTGNINLERDMYFGFNHTLGEVMRGEVS